MRILLVIVFLCCFSCGSTKATKEQQKTTTEIESIPQQEIKEDKKLLIDEVNDHDIIEDHNEVKPIVEDKLEDNKTIKVIFDHTNWNNLLQQLVSENGNVDYKAFKQQWSKLRDYIASLSNNIPKDSWPKEEKLAYWINAYNAMTVDLILRHYPVKSIKDIKKPWEQRLWKLGEKWYNLNEIEHSILRKMNEPRIHFAIVCASFSCPKLQNRAFTASNFNSLIKKSTTEFLYDIKRNKLGTSKMELSKIFKWFTKDFEKDGSLIEFLKEHADFHIFDNAKISYLDYNWDLND